MSLVVIYYTARARLSLYASPRAPCTSIPSRELLRDTRVKFAGYKHPHPLDNDIIVRVQSAAGLPPTQALIAAAERLEGEFRLMLSAFSADAARLKRQGAEL